MQKGKQRYKCAECVKIFKETTGVALEIMSKKDLFLKFQDSMINEENCSLV